MKRLLAAVFLIFLISNYAFATVFGRYYIGASEPVTASEVKTYTKKAEGSCISILSLVAFGDASIKTLAEKAGISEINHIDKNTFSILGLFVQETYTIYGN